MENELAAANSKIFDLSAPLESVQTRVGVFNSVKGNGNVRNGKDTGGGNEVGSDGVLGKDANTTIRGMVPITSSTPLQVNRASNQKHGHGYSTNPNQQQKQYLYSSNTVGNFDKEGIVENKEEDGGRGRGMNAHDKQGFIKSVQKNAMKHTRRVVPSVPLAPSTTALNAATASSNSVAVNNGVKATSNADAFGASKAMSNVAGGAGIGDTTFGERDKVIRHGNGGLQYNNNVTVRSSNRDDVGNGIRDTGYRQTGQQTSNTYPREIGNSKYMTTSDPVSGRNVGLNSGLNTDQNNGYRTSTRNRLKRGAEMDHLEGYDQDEYFYKNVRDDANGNGERNGNGSGNQRDNEDLVVVSHSGPTAPAARSARAARGVRDGREERGDVRGIEYMRRVVGGIGEGRGGHTTGSKEVFQVPPPPKKAKRIEVNQTEGQCLSGRERVEKVERQRIGQERVVGVQQQHRIGQQQQQRIGVNRVYNSSLGSTSHHTVAAPAAAPVIREVQNPNFPIVQATTAYGTRGGTYLSTRNGNMGTRNGSINTRNGNTNTAGAINMSFEDRSAYSIANASPFRRIHQRRSGVGNTRNISNGSIW